MYTDPKVIYDSYFKHAGRDAIEAATHHGMILKKDLLDNEWYYGHGLGATKAQWCEGDNCFYYNRVKFGDTFLDKMAHPEDEKAYAVFVPVELMKDRMNKFP